MITSLDDISIPTVVFTAYLFNSASYILEAHFKKSGASPSSSSNLLFTTINYPTDFLRTLIRHYYIQSLLHHNFLPLVITFPLTIFETTILQFMVDLKGTTMS